MPTDKVASRIVGSAMEAAFEKSRKPVDIGFYRQEFDPNGAPSKELPTDSEMTQLRNWMRIFYSKGNNLRLVKEAKFNPFKAKAQWCNLDLLTDSGTGTLYEEQKKLIATWEGQVPPIWTTAYAGSVARQMFDMVMHEVFGNFTPAFVDDAPKHFGNARLRTTLRSRAGRQNPLC